MEADQRPTLFYKHTCPPCQWMSRLACLLSLGVIRRRPLDSREAEELYRRFPEHAGQLVLIDLDRVTFGRMVFAAVPGAVLHHWITASGTRMRRLFRFLARRGRVSSQQGRMS